MSIYYKAIAVALLVCFTGIGAAYTAAADEKLQTTEIDPLMYKIGPGDILRISVWKEEGMEQEVLVKPDGGITFPLVGDMKASGMTTSGLTAAIKNRLRRYIPDPVVTVSVLQAVSNKIYVVGKVNRPGEYNATHYMDVLQALSLAGGLTPFAESDEIKIIRRGDNKKETFNFDYDEVISGKRLDMNIILKAGDTVAVP